MAYKVFTNGSVLNASEINDNLMNQSVMVFSNSTARAAALTAPVEGMLTWLQDTDKYEYYSGAGAWVELVSSPTWTSFTPTWTNLTVGNGTYTSSSYSLNGKIAQVNIRLVFGSTTSISGDVSFTVPAAITRKVATTPSNNFLLLGDVPTSNFVGNVISSSLSATSFLLRVSLANTTYTNLDAISATVPHTWGTSDVISLAMTYEVA